jgi:hypothetical protein
VDQADVAGVTLIWYDWSTTTSGWAWIIPITHITAGHDSVALISQIISVAR